MCAVKLVFSLMHRKVWMSGTILPVSGLTGRHTLQIKRTWRGERCDPFPFIIKSPVAPNGPK